jgi:hypothetical protein
MSQDTPHDRLARVRALRERATDVALRLEQQAQQYARKGRLSDSRLLHDCQALDSDVRRFTELLRPQFEVEADASLVDCERVLVEDQRRSAVGEIVARILSIEGIARAPLAGLARCQSDAKALGEQLKTSSRGADDALLESLLRGQHPWCDLLALMDHHDSLSADRWRLLSDAVGQALGGDVAAAAARGQLRCRPEQSPDVWTRIAKAEALVEAALDERPKSAISPPVAPAETPVKLTKEVTGRPVAASRVAVAPVPAVVSRREPPVHRRTSADQGPTIRALGNRRLACTAGLILFGVALVATLSLGLKAGVDTHFRWRADATRPQAPSADIN